jgi:hypothetical protein
MIGGGIFIVMKKGFVVVPSGTDPEGSTTKATFAVIFFALKRPFQLQKRIPLE